MTDIAINTVGIPINNPISKKPSYLIILEEFNGKTRSYSYFLTFDKPEFISSGFVQARGFFCDYSPEEITKNFIQILTSVDKELICEMMFPQHRIYSMKSLVFKAK